MVDENKEKLTETKGNLAAFGLSSWLKIAIMAAFALLLMLAVRVPIVPIAPFLTFDFAEVPALILAFALGPWAGAAVVAIKCALYMVINFHPLELIGVPANLITGLILVCSSSSLYNVARGEEFSYKRLCLAMLLGSLITVAVMLPINFCIYLLLRELFAESVPMSMGSYLIGAVLPFNAVKCFLTCVVAGICMRRLVHYLTGKSNDGR